MRGRARYTFEIARRQEGNSWRLLIAKSGLFSRGPKQTVRSIAERWIHEQQGQLRGGRLVIRGKRGDAPRRFEATVRVRILADDGQQLAVAYIGTDRVDTYSPPDSSLASFSQLAGRGHG
jgi:hypothetical protein